MTLNGVRDEIVVRDELRWETPPRVAPLKDQVEALERAVISASLWRHRWNRTRVAKELGLSRVGLGNKIRRYKLDGGGE